MIKNIGFNPTETAEKYLNAIPPKDMISELNWRVIANGISDIESKQVGFIVAQKDAFAKVASLTRVDKKMVRLVEDNLYQPANFGDTLQYNKRRPIAASFQIQKVDSLLFRFDILIAEKTGDWKKYQKTADAGVEKYVWKDSNTLVEIGRNYAFFVDDKKEIQNSISWIKQAITLGETMEKYVLITKLYIKQNDYKNALEYAKKGKDLGVSFNWKTEEMDTLLTEIKKHAK